MTKYINKNSLPYLLLLVILSLLCVARFTLFDYGFQTFYDDAYFLLKAKEVKEGVITGKSQWNFIAVNWFPYMDLSSMIQSRMSGYILMLATVLNATIASIVAFGNKNCLKYLAVCLLLLLPKAGQMSYVALQTFLLCTSVSAFIIYWKKENIWLKYGMLLVAGFMAGLSLFVIMPAGLLTLAFYVIILLIMNGRRYIQSLKEIGVGIVGVVLCVAYMHLCICPVDKIVDAMRFTASYFTKTGYGYDFLSMCSYIGLFVRDSIFVIVFYIGAYFLSKKVVCGKFAWIGGLVYLVLVFICFNYQKKPAISPYVFFSSVVLIPLAFECENGGFKAMLSKDTIMRLFLFCFPVIASVGSNTFSFRVACFIVAWAFLWFEQKEETKWYVALAAILAILVPYTLKTVNTLNNRDDRFHFTRGNKYFAEISLTEKQKEYYDNMYDLMSDYGFKSNSSVVFTALFDYATVYAFDAVLSSNFHQTNNFLYWDTKDMLRPDFIILSGWDEKVMGERLRTMGWGWPEEFDAYGMGTPESRVQNFSNAEKRTVYCRKK